MSDTIDTLGNLPDEWADYEQPSDNPRPPEPKVYSFRRSDEEGHFTCGTFEYDGGEYAWFNFRGLIQGGPDDGRIAFGGMNTMPSKFRKGTSVQDFVMACHANVRPTSAELLAAVKAQRPTVLHSLYGPFTAKTTWEWNCRDCDETFLKGAKNPKAPKKYTGPKAVVARLADKSVHHEQTCPTCKATVGARLIITDFVVRVNGAASGPAPTAPVAPEGMAPAAG